MENINYKDFIDNCQTGDLLLYSSRCWYSYIIETLGWSKYSHVSIIVRDASTNELYIFESGGENVIDVIKDKKIFGVQLIKLEDALKVYQSESNGCVYYVKNNFERTNEFNEKIKKIIIDTDGKPYDLHLIDWIGARFDLKIIKREKIRFFCSALVAYTFTLLNFLSDDTDWTIVSPREYSYYEKSRLKFINCDLEPERLIRNIFIH
jgi:hypothetical protein